ncbi:cobyrinic acid a,c-diamide synthase [Methanolinea mesophila]|uniref:Ni-sirohydrochlorin a,c-diamide synthase n=1 Tax=Methanolinea mesophila TaxID=547055 RepID=UPI001AE2C22D|nr:Ni-sirohydrochlorin a,c-diamide synthase [Methanolinea mesophila]MBP1927680.1 cobyrinic acid a,c-diamide synthase [Methanolinea mesophila]
MKALMVAGDRSGSGKTSISLAIAALLSSRFTVQTFKVGMDYIDPSYLTGVTGRPCRNLDTFVMSPDELRQIFFHGCTGADLALVEGVRGLFEGAEALGDPGSSADVAKALDLPVVLVINARSITRSAAAIVKGFQAMDPQIRIAGVILNNVTGPKHRDKAVAAVEHYCGIPVIGAIPRKQEMELAMRHLGLVPYLEGKTDREFDQRISTVTGVIGEHLDLDRLLTLARDCPATLPPAPLFAPAASMDLSIGVALDEAFNFYYGDLFDILATYGAKAVPFSPIHDRLPEVDGVIIGGGYPELFLPELEANSAMRDAIREMSRNGTPVYAECGGLMYLTDSVILREGWQGSEEEQSCGMCGVFPGDTVMPARRVVSYVEGESVKESPLGAARFRGHEFHYSDVQLPADTRFAYRLSRGIGIKGSMDGAWRDNTVGSYTHLHPVSSREMFAQFLDGCRAERGRR